MKTLFELNPALDLPAYAARFAATGRVQLRDVLTPDSARELQMVLARGTDWGIAVGAGTEKPTSIRAARSRRGPAAKNGAARIASPSSRPCPTSVPSPR